MRRAALIGVVVAIAAACGPAPAGPSQQVTAGARGEADSVLCPTFSAIYAERDRLADAYELALAGRAADAETEAKAISARVDNVERAMPAADGLSETDRNLRQIAAGAGLQITDAASFLLGLGGPPPGIEVVASDGRNALEVGDATLRRLHETHVRAACPDLALLIRPVSFPAAASAEVSPAASEGAAPTGYEPSLPDAATFGLPARIGTWKLLIEPEPTTEGDLITVFITAAGGDPATAVAANVQVSGDGARLSFDVFRVPGVGLDAFAGAAAHAAWPHATVRTSLSPVPGWTVLRFSTPAGATDPETYYVAEHGGQFYTIGNFSEVALTTLLAGLP